jgi:polygalacturonase
MHDFEIYVDIVGQLELQRLFASRTLTNMLSFSDGINLPIFPLNTDGIDPTGYNMTFRNIKITNFDDAIVAKPGNKGPDHKFGDCTQDILIEDCEITFGVGMSIGSVSPNTNHACVRNITVRNIKFNYPLKAIYIKTNPGDEGDGEIVNITFENIVMDRPVWWGIYIGP